VRGNQPGNQQPEIVSSGSVGSAQSSRSLQMNSGGSLVDFNRWR
jgi:hypothetical protein